MLRAFRENWAALALAAVLSLVTVQLDTEPPFMASVHLQADGDMVLATNQQFLTNKTFGPERIISARLPDLHPAVPSGSVRYLIDKGAWAFKVKERWLCAKHGADGRLASSPTPCSAMSR